VSVSKHFCGGKVRNVSITLLNDAKGCGMEDAKTSNACENNQIKKNCCEDSFQTFVVENDYLPQKQEASFSSIFSLIYLTSIFLSFVFSLYFKSEKIFVFPSPPTVIPTKKALALKQVYRL
tara:strand:- start:37563 stop:37925 length:363 start_codon:yes stop_codon:yes gene_type:complete